MFPLTRVPFWVHIFDPQLFQDTPVSTLASLGFILCAVRTCVGREPNIKRAKTRFRPFQHVANRLLAGGAAFGTGVRGSPNAGATPHDSKDVLLIGEFGEK